METPLGDPPDQTPGDPIERSLQDPSAFTVVFDDNFAVIHRYLARRVAPDVADDLASEVFVVAFEKRATFDPARGAVLPWLYGIAVNVLRSHRRAAARQARLAHRALEDRVYDDFVPDLAETVDAGRAARELAPALRALSEPDRTTLLLHAWEGLTYPEIAQALDVPVGTVRSRLNRVRRKLREPNSRLRTRKR